MILSWTEVLPFAFLCFALSLFCYTCGYGGERGFSSTSWSGEDSGKGGVAFGGGGGKEGWEIDTSDSQALEHRKDRGREAEKGE